MLLRSSRLSLTFFVCFFVSTRQFLISTPFHISVSLPIFVPIKMGTKKGALTLVIAPFQSQSAHIHVPLVYISNLSYWRTNPQNLPIYLRDPIVNQYCVIIPQNGTIEKIQFSLALFVYHIILNMTDGIIDNFHSNFATKNDKEKPGNITSWFN